MGPSCASRASSARPAFRRKRWPAENTFGGYAKAVTTAGSDMLVFETRYDNSPLARVIPWQWTWATGCSRSTRSRVSRQSAISGRRTFGESRLDVDCMADVLSAGGLVCSVYDGTRTHIVQIAARTGNVEGIGWLDGHFYSNQNVVRGWLTGWAGGGRCRNSCDDGRGRSNAGKRRRGQLGVGRGRPSRRRHDGRRSLHRAGVSAAAGHADSGNDARATGTGTDGGENKRSEVENRRSGDQELC